MSQITAPQHQQPDGGKSGKSKSSGGCAVILLIVVGVSVVGFLSNISWGTDPAAPVLLTRSNEQTLSDDLAQATRYQNICYGWDVTLHDYYSDRGGSTHGSNQGGGTRLDTSRCDRWVEFQAVVTWTSSSNSSPDSARYRFRSSASLDTSSLTKKQLESVGFDLDRLTSDPAIATENVMEALPLLMAQSGAAPPLPVDQSEGNGKRVVDPVPANSDTWRNGKYLIIFGGIAILAAIGCLVVGLIFWRRRKGGAGGPSDPDPPTGPIAVQQPKTVPRGPYSGMPQAPPPRNPNNPPGP